MIVFLLGLIAGAILHAGLRALWRRGRRAYWDHRYGIALGEAVPYGTVGQGGRLAAEAVSAARARGKRWLERRKRAAADAAGNAAGTGVRLSFEPRSPSAARWRPPAGVEGGEVLDDVLDELDRRTNPAADRMRSKAEWLAALQTELCAAGAGERAEATDVALVRLAAVALLALRTRAKTREASDG
jgi:hypothetical protein